MFERNMFIYLQFLLLICACCVAGRLCENARISGGSPASIENFPYMVSISVEDTFKCAASIINPYWVLTSAQCVSGVNQDRISLRAGSNLAASKGSNYTVSKVIAHKDYNDKTHVNDIALIQVKTPFQISKPEIGAIDLPLQDEAVPTGKDAIAVGFGKTSSESPVLPQPLNQITIPIISNDACKKSEPGVTGTMVCAGFTTGGKGTCTGDEGGPLALDKKLVGISWGVSCGKSGKPSVFTKVSSFRNWIKTNSGV